MRLFHDKNKNKELLLFELKYLDPDFLYKKKGQGIYRKFHIELMKLNHPSRPSVYTNYYVMGIT